MATVAAQARQVIFGVYPAAYDASAAQVECPVSSLGEVSSVMQYEGTSGVLLEFDSPGLVALARHRPAVRQRFGAEHSSQVPDRDHCAHRRAPVR